MMISASGCGTDPNGGTAGTGGKGGAGGNGGSGSQTLGAIVGTAVETFATEASATKFILSNYATDVNLAFTMPGATTLKWNATEGSPDPGSLVVMAPFSDWNQWVEVQAVTQMPLLNWTGKKLHVRVKVGSGLGQDPYALSGGQALVDTTTAYVQGNHFQNLLMNNQWQEFTLDLSTVAMTGFDATMVITFGIQITSGSGSSTPGTLKPTAATLYFDSFSIE
jgi:hypothetical protein